MQFFYEPLCTPGDTPLTSLVMHAPTKNACNCSRMMIYVDTGELTTEQINVTQTEQNTLKKSRRPIDTSARFLSIPCLQALCSGLVCLVVCCCHRMRTCLSAPRHALLALSRVRKLNSTQLNYSSTYQQNIPGQATFYTPVNFTHPGASQEQQN